MGCGASVAGVSVASRSTRQPSEFHSLRAVVPTHVLEKGPRKAAGDSVREDQAGSSMMDQQLKEMTSADSGKADGTASQSNQKRCVSSWDSAAWTGDVPRHVPLPPDRRLHEQHVKPGLDLGWCLLLSFFWNMEP